MVNCQSIRPTNASVYKLSSVTAVHEGSLDFWKTPVGPIHIPEWKLNVNTEHKTRDKAINAGQHNKPSSNHNYVGED